MLSTREEKENENDDFDGSITPKKNRIGHGDALREKRKHRKQKYRSEWERDPICFPWLGPDPESLTNAICKWCNSSLVADIALIKKHKDTNKHLKRSRDRRTVPSNGIQQFVPVGKRLKKPLARRRREEHEALDTLEDILPKPMITRVSQPRFALSWESYQTRLCSKLSTLLKNEDFVDLTLAAGGHLVKVHQLIMGIASPYLKEIIRSSPTKHPIIFLTNVSYPTLQNLLQYVYTGQVDITEDELEPFFAAAKALQIQGIDTEIDTEILKSQASYLIGGDTARLPPEPNETAEEDVLDDDFEESQINLIPRSAIRRSNSPDARKILPKHRSTRRTSPTKKEPLSQTEELEPEDQGDVMMDEDMVVVASEELSGGVVPIEFFEVSRTDDPDAVNSPQHENAETVTVQTMLLNNYKYTLVKTFEDGMRTWNCIDHLKHGCQATVVTNGNTVIKKSQSHNHPFHDHN